MASSHNDNERLNLSDGSVVLATMNDRMAVAKLSGPFAPERESSCER